MESKSTRPTQQLPKLTQDLYPGLTSFEFSPQTARILRQQGYNPTQMQEQFAEAHRTKNFQGKAQLAHQFSGLEDRINGGSIGANFLESHRARSAEESAPVYNSVGAGQGFFGSIKNGLVEAVQAVPQLLVAGAGLRADLVAYAHANHSFYVNPKAFKVVAIAF